MNYCQKVIELSLSYGAYKEQCGKPAVIKDCHGRHLCQKHFNKWVKKSNQKKS